MIAKEVIFFEKKKDFQLEKKRNFLSNNANLFYFLRLILTFLIYCLSREFFYSPGKLFLTFSYTEKGKLFSVFFVSFFSFFSLMEDVNYVWMLDENIIWFSLFLLSFLLHFSCMSVLDNMQFFTDFKVGSWGKFSLLMRPWEAFWRDREEKIHGRGKERLWGCDLLLKPCFSWGVNCMKNEGKARARLGQSGRKKRGFFFFSYTSFLFSFLCFSLLHLGDFLPFSWVSRVKIFPVLSCFPFLFHWWICEGKCAALLALSPAVFQYDSLLFLTFQWLITNKKQNGFPKLSWTNMKRKWNFSVILTWRSKQTFKWKDFYRFFWRSSRTWIEKLYGLKTAKQRQTKGIMNRNQ